MKFDLEAFPQNKTAQRMLQRISPVYGQSYVGKWLLEVLGMELEEAQKRILELLDQAFPETATWGLRYWEQRFGIVPDHRLHLEERRKNVLFRRSIRAPMNPARIELAAGTVTGGKVIVAENVAPYTFRVEIQQPAEYVIDAAKVRDKLQKMKPSHLCMEIELQNQPAVARLHAVGVAFAVTHTTLTEMPYDYGFQLDLRAGGGVSYVMQTHLTEIEGGNL